MYPAGQQTVHLTQLVVTQQPANPDFERVVDLNEILHENLAAKDLEIIRLKEELLVQANKIKELQAQLSKRQLDDIEASERARKQRKMNDFKKPNPSSTTDLPTFLENSQSSSSESLSQLDTSIPAFEVSESSLSASSHSSQSFGAKEPEHPEFSEHFPTFKYSKTLPNIYPLLPTTQSEEFCSSPSSKFLANRGINISEVLKSGDAVLPRE